MAIVNSKSTAIILLFAGAVLLVSTAATSSMPPHKAVSMEACVELLFDPPPSMKRIICRDLLRTVTMSMKATGKLLPEYVAAVKKVPKFQNNPEALNKFLCGLSPVHVSGCSILIRIT